MRKEVFPAGCCKKKGFRSGLSAVYPILMLLFIVSTGWTQTLPLKAHIPWGWINDFEFYGNGVFIASDYGDQIRYYTVDENFSLTYRYTIYPGGLHQLSQLCVEESYLFALDGSSIHEYGTPVLFDYEVNETGYEYLGGVETGGTVSVTFGSVLYHDGSVIYYESGDYYRVDVTQPENPVETGCVLGTYDVCRDIIAYQDTLLITARQHGTGFWDGNLRIMRNIPPDSLISVGTYGFNSYSFTTGLVSIDNFLFTSHKNGLRVYDLSDLGNVQQIYFYPTDGARSIAQLDNVIFVGCDNGWHFFEYTSSGEIQHLEFYPNDTRVLRMRVKPEEEELWCFVDEGSLGGLVVLDLSGSTGIGESETGSVSGLLSIQSFPNPFSIETTISCSIPVDGHTTLRVYNLKGQLVRTLADDYMQSPQSGCYSVHWDGRDDGNRPMPNSVYICRLVSGNSTATCRLMLVK